MPTLARERPTADAAVAQLALDRVGFEIAGRPILSDLSLEVRSRETVCLLGPSGCGKTTLLRVAAGIERQGTGRVAVGGRTVADASTFVPPEARRLGFVFQDLALFPHLRVADNVAYGLTGVRRGEALRRAAEALEGVGLSGYERAYPHELSGGQQQRVALARALLPAPQVVLFDEPFSGLDRDLRDAVRADVIAVLRERGATALLVTHDPEEALAVASRIALMREGAIVQLATPEEIWRWPVDLAAARVFSPVNAFHARVAGGLADTPVGRVPVGAEREGERLTIAFRPEALRVFPNERAAGVQASVERRRFFGTHVEITARAPSGHRLVLRADPYQVPHASTVRVVPDLRQAIVLSGEQ
ncbi:ABC transporter ATP-binding protein [Acuticoccus sp.]|uniref:ABC transporter ATP-binding protein n=1 Tax=Acuticoccus sp. TaxID=1904378 RepID=UPI003B52EF31